MLKSSGSLNNITDFFGENDAVLLLEDGVYAGIINHPNTQSLLSLSQSIFAMESDLLIRGLQSRLDPNIVPINYDQFVDLVLKYEKVVTW